MPSRRTRASGTSSAAVRPAARRKWSRSLVVGLDGIPVGLEGAFGRSGRIAIGPLGVAHRLGGPIEAGDGVGVRGVERRNVVRQELDERQLGLLDSLDNAFGQFVAAVVGMMRGIV